MVENHCVFLHLKNLFKIYLIVEVYDFIIFQNDGNIILIGFLSSLVILTEYKRILTYHFDPPFQTSYTFKYIKDEQKIIFKTSKNYFITDIRHVNKPLLLKIDKLDLDFSRPNDNNKYEISNKTGNVIVWNPSEYVVYSTNNKVFIYNIRIIILLFKIVHYH